MKTTKRGVPLTRNAETMTEAQFWSMLRSGLRRTFRYWKPITNAKNAARRKYTGPNKRQKWEYQCEHCKGWFKGTEVDVDHVVPVGSLTAPEHIAPFIERLTAEIGYQVLCKPCHQIVTNKEREEIKQRRNN